MSEDADIADVEELIVRKSPGSRKGSYREDEYIFREGELGDLAFVVLSGKVEISRKIDKKDIPIGIVNKGGMFGEMALIDARERMASARAIQGNVEVLVISRRVFHAKLESADPFQRALISILTKHIRALADKVSTLETKIS